MALALLAPGIAAALGVGDYELNSYLNQPLDMRVKLSDTGELAQDEILVELAADEDYERSGVQRSQLHSRLNFEVELDEDAQTGTIHITTDKPVREPYINFLTEVLWPTGRMLREFTVLLDPPTQEQQQKQPAQPETQDTRTDQQEREEATRGEQESVSRPVEPREPAEPTRSEAEESQAPVAEAPEPEDRQTYTVKQQDTMWQVAQDYRPDSSVSVQQMLSAIKQLNQDAFIDGNVNLVREGAVLRIPSQQEIRAINTRKAMQELASQNRQWREMLQARGIDPDSAPLQGTPSPGEGERRGTGEGEVQLVTEDGESTGEGSGAGGEGSADSQQLENQLAMREENLDRLERENEELSSRLDDLEEQVQTSEQLLQLREEKIARLQEELEQLSESEGVDVSEDLMEPVEQPDAQDTADAEGTAGDEPTDGEAGPADDAEQAGEDDGEQTADAQTDTEEGAQGEDTAEGTAEQDAASGDEEAADAGEDGEAAQGDDEAAAQTEPAERADQQDPGTTEPEAQPSLVERILDFIMGNLMLIGAGLVGLIALVVAAVLMLRRGGDQGLAEEGPMVEADEDDDFLPAGLMDDDEGEFGSGDDDQGAGSERADEGQDPLEEADLYVVYGRHQQAVDYLRGEIRKAPERNDLKIRQLDILAEMDDSDAFEQEAANLTGSDPEVDSHIDTLRGKLGGGGAGSEEPSLDDLEMDLSSGLDEGGGTAEATPAAEPAESGAGDEDLESLDDFGDFDLSLDEDSGTGQTGDTGGEDLEFDLSGESAEEDNSIDFEPSSVGDTDEELTLDTGETESESESESETEGGDELGDLEFSLDDLDTGEDSGEEDLLDIGEDNEAPATGAPAADESASTGSRSDEEAASEAEPSLDLDDSFDFELESSGGDDDTSFTLDEENVSSEFSEASEESAADDLDLSLDDLDTGEGEGGGEDLDATLGELETGTDSAAEPASGDDELELDLDEGDTDETRGAAPEPEPEPSVSEASSEPAPEPASGGESEAEAMGADDLLGDDDDFDFLGDSDENATKLDLAKAYIDMGDNEGARDILNEVLAEGTEGQQGEARELLSQVG